MQDVRQISTEVTIGGRMENFIVDFYCCGVFYRMTHCCMNLWCSFVVAESVVISDDDEDADDDESTQPKLPKKDADPSPFVTPQAQVLEATNYCFVI